MLRGWDLYQFIAKQIKELVSEQGLDVFATTANVQLNWAVTVFNAFFGWYEEQRPGGATMTCCVQWSVHACVQGSIGGQRMNLYQVTFTFYPEQNILTSSKLATCPRTQAESVLIVHGVFQDWRCWSNCSDRISGRRLGLIFSWMQRQQWPEGIRLRLLTMCTWTVHWEFGQPRSTESWPVGNSLTCNWFTEWQIIDGHGFQ